MASFRHFEAEFKKCLEQTRRHVQQGTGARQGRAAASGARPVRTATSGARPVRAAAAGAQRNPINGSRSLKETSMQVSKLLVAKSRDSELIDMPMDLVTKAVTAATSGIDFVVFLKRITDVREITRNGPADPGKAFALVFEDEKRIDSLLKALQADHMDQLAERLKTPGKVAEIVKTRFRGKQLLSFSQAHFLDHKNGGVCHGITYLSLIHI